MTRCRLRAVSLIELLIVIAIIAVISSLTLSAHKHAREAAENLKIAQVVRGGVSRCAQLKVRRDPSGIFYATWKGDQNESRSAFLMRDSSGEFVILGGSPWQLP